MIDLDSPDALILAGWRRLLGGWVREETPAAPDLRLSLRLVEHLPPPAGPLLYSDHEAHPERPAILNVYDLGDGAVQLHFHDAAQITLSLRQMAGLLLAEGVMVKEALTNGRFEDITYTSLAPLLRRRGYFLLHAFAAAREGRAALLVGASGSGKTTSGLSLLLAGWELLSNDVVLLQARPNGVYALPTPDAVSIRPYSLTLLPALREWLPGWTGERPLSVSAYELVNSRWAAPAPIHAIYFPQIETRPESALRQMSRAVALARLLEESVDTWDTPLLADHLAILHAISQQATPFTLRLGQNPDHIPTLLS
jgi:hypothetical protein